MEWFDPIYWLGEEGYRSFVSSIMQIVFNGILARIFSATFLIIGVWFVFRRKQTPAGIGFICLSVAVIFGKSVCVYLGIL